jgi:glycosyltransferase involved in cell wall biosynthesis
MRPLVLLPACNEAACLPSVVREVCSCFPASDVLIVDDASEDSTTRLLAELGVGWIRLPERAGVGGAVRRGLEHARRMGYDTVVRLDADGQHIAHLARSLLDALRRQGADAAVGSRYMVGGGYRAGFARRLGQLVLGAGLSLRLGSRVTDPTSGFWAFGPRAVELLAARHPAGYSEPQLRLLLHRQGLRVVEVGVPMRGRLAGRTTLTPARAAFAFARACLALLAVPGPRAADLRGRWLDCKDSQILPEGRI